jgi:16S rRNA (uracil1498-N3)-methyltransferase
MILSKSRFIHEAELKAGDEIMLSADESHHLAHVMRLKVGEAVEVVNGRGALALGRVASASAKGARISLDAVSAQGAASRITIAFGVPKPPAMEFILRRATEVGVGAFQPLVTRHSLRLSEWNERRWSKIIHEVCKQCQELRFPELLAPVKLESWLGARPAGRCAVLFDEEDRATRAPLPTTATGYDLLVGPEGGWSPEETALLKAAGAVVYGLGRNRLRAEMAALVGAALIKRDIGEI